MNKAELTQVLDDSTPIESATVMVLDQASGVVSSIQEVKAEFHEDADGSTTVWLIVEEI